MCPGLVYTSECLPVVSLRSITLTITFTSFLCFSWLFYSLPPSPSHFSYYFYFSFSYPFLFFPGPWRFFMTLQSIIQLPQMCFFLPVNMGNNVQRNFSHLRKNSEHADAHWHRIVKLTMVYVCVCVCVCIYIYIYIYIKYTYIYTHNNTHIIYNIMYYNI